MKQKHLYLPPEVNMLTVRIEAVLCTSVEKSFATNDFDDITEEDIDSKWWK